MDFILPTLVCQDPDIHASTPVNIILPLLVMKPEEETIFNQSEWEWKVIVVTCRVFTRYMLSPGSSLDASFSLHFYPHGGLQSLDNTEQSCLGRTHSQLWWRSEEKKEPTCRAI